MSSFIPKVTISVGGYKFKFSLPTADQRKEMTDSWMKYRDSETTDEMDKVQADHLRMVMELCQESLTPDAGDNWKEDARRELFSGPTATKLLMELFRSPAPIAISAEE